MRWRGTAGLIVIISTVAFASPAEADESGSFSDDDRHPAEAWLDWLGDEGVVDGCNPPDDDRSCPDAHVTRAQAAKIVVRLGELVGTIDPSSGLVRDSFIDDEETLGGGGEPLIEQLVAVGALHGCDPPVNRRVCPEREITRGQAAKILVTAFDLSGDTDGAVWPDNDGRFYEEAAAIAAANGLWAERSTFDGRDAITRGELAKQALIASGIEVCVPDPFTQDRIQEAADRYPNQLVTAHVYDVETGCHYRLNHENRQRTASVFKVMVMAGTLLEAQREGREPTDWEWDQMYPMITESANSPVRALWYSFGASPWYVEQGETFGLDETTVRGDDGSAWGLTTTSAADQVDLLRQVLLGEWGPLDAPYREHALTLMDDVIDSQTWGVTAGVPDDWEVAQKNGFAGITINSVGWVRRPGIDEGYVVAILGQGWPDHPTGIAAAERISEWIADALIG